MEWRVPMLRVVAEVEEVDQLLAVRSVVVLELLLLKQ